MTTAEIAPTEAYSGVDSTLVLAAMLDERPTFRLWVVPVAVLIVPVPRPEKLPMPGVETSASST